MWTSLEFTNQVTQWQYMMKTSVKTKIYGNLCLLPLTASFPPFNLVFEVFKSANLSMSSARFPSKICYTIMTMHDEQEIGFGGRFAQWRCVMNAWNKKSAYLRLLLFVAAFSRAPQLMVECSSEDLLVTSTGRENQFTQCFTLETKGNTWIRLRSMKT